MMPIRLPQLKTQFLKSLKPDLKFGQRALSAKSDSSSQAVFVERYEEDPVIVINEKDDIDIIGPADSVSNLRPIIRKKLPKESDLQRQLREQQNETQRWNQEFWVKHNTNFMKERHEYIKSRQVEDKKLPLSAEEMSEFYKKFLDKNWERHLKYNMEWYKRNFAVLVLALRVNLEKNLSRFR